MEQGGADKRLKYIANDILTKARAPKNTSGDIDFHLRAYVTKSLKHHSARLVDILIDQFASNNSLDVIESYLSHMDDYLTQCCRQRTIQLTEQNENVDDLHNNHFNDVHAEALKRYSSVLTQDLRIAGTVVLDNLVQNKALSEIGRQSIIQRKTLSKVNSAFLKYCNGLSCTTFKEKVLPALKNSNDEVNMELANDIEKGIEGISTFGTAKVLCVSCKVRNTVNYRRLADTLYEMNAISDNMRDDLSSSHLSNATKWKQLLKKKHIKTLPLALKKKYPCLYREMQLTPHNIMHCTCCIYTEDEEDMEVDGMSDVARMSDISSRSNTTASTLERKSEISSKVTYESMDVFPDDRTHNICSLKTSRLDQQCEKNHFNKCQNQRQGPIHGAEKERVQIWLNNIHDNTSVDSCNKPQGDCSPRSESQHIVKPDDSIPLTEREREYILPKNILRKPYQKHRQEPFGSADITSKRACLPGSKSSPMESLKQIDANPRSIHLTVEEREQIVQKNIQQQANQKKHHQGPFGSADVTLKKACSARSEPRIHSMAKLQDPKMRPIHWIEKERVNMRQKIIQRQAMRGNIIRDLWVKQTNTSKGASASGSKSSQVECLNQQMETQSSLIHLNETEREKIVQKNVKQQANQKKQHQRPLSSFKARFVSKITPTHLIEKEQVKIRKKKSSGASSSGSNLESSP